MKLSIITINYNNLDGLKKTVDSVLSQTWRDFEWIIVDGGSTDGSKEYIESLAQSLLEGTAIDSVQWNVERFSLLGFTAEDLKTQKIESSSDQSSNHSSSIANRQSSIANQPQHFLWCSEPDKGVYNAMNKGISKANGEYIQFLNSGDYFFDLDSLLNVFHQFSNTDIIYGNCLFGDNEEGVEVCCPSKLSLSFFLKSSLCHPSSFISSCLLKEFCYREDFRIVSDWYWFFVNYMNGRTFSQIKSIITIFDTTGISSTSKQLEMQERTILILELLSADPTRFTDEIVSLQDKLDSYNHDDIYEVKRLIRRGHFRKKAVSMFLSVIKKLDLLTNNYY